MVFTYDLLCLSCGAMSAYDFGYDGAVWSCSKCDECANLELVACSDNRFGHIAVENFVRDFENDDYLSHLILMSDTGLSLDEVRDNFVARVYGDDFEDYVIETIVGETALLDRAVRWYLDVDMIMTDFEHDYMTVFDEVNDCYAIYKA